LTNKTACIGSIIPDLLASGITGATIRWYSDFALTNLVNTGTSYATGKTTPGVYKYYVNQKVGDCVSPIDTAKLTIYALPVANAGSNVNIPLFIHSVRRSDWSRRDWHLVRPYP